MVTVRRGRSAVVDCGGLSRGRTGRPRHLAGVQGDVGGVGDPDERVDAGHALGDIAEVGPRGHRLRQDAGGQRVAAALALGADNC